MIFVEVDSPQPGLPTLEQASALLGQFSWGNCMCIKVVRGCFERRPVGVLRCVLDTGTYLEGCAA